MLIRYSAFLLLSSSPLNERRRYCDAGRLCVCLCVRRAATARHISLGGEGNALYPLLSSYYLHRHLASREDIVKVLRPAVCVSTEPRLHAVGGEGNALYPELSSYYYF